MADTQKVWNLDQDINEYFEFQVKGHTYKFRYPNAQELDNFKKLGDDTSAEGQQKANDYMMTYIEPVSENAPKFEEVFKTLIPPHIKKFTEMVTFELSGKN